MKKYTFVGGMVSIFRTQIFHFFAKKWNFIKKFTVIIHISFSYNSSVLKMNSIVHIQTETTLVRPPRLITMADRDIYHTADGQTIQVPKEENSSTILTALPPGQTTITIPLPSELFERLRAGLSLPPPPLARDVGRQVACSEFPEWARSTHQS
jgi:hypothetical protein